MKNGKDASRLAMTLPKIPECLKRLTSISGIFYITNMRIQITRKNKWRALDTNIGPLKTCHIR